MVRSLVRCTASCVARNSPKRYLEPDLRAAVEAEEVLDQIAEVALAERPREAVGDAERALVPGQPQGRRQADQGEVGLGQVDVEVGIVVLGRRTARRRWPLAVRPAAGRRRRQAAGQRGQRAGRASPAQPRTSRSRSMDVTVGASIARARSSCWRRPRSIQRRMTGIWPSVRKGPAVRGMRIAGDVRAALELAHEIAVVGIAGNDQRLARTAAGWAGSTRLP